MAELLELEADVFVVASFGKILPKALIELPKFGSVNVHPSLLPKYRGPSPIQNSILNLGEPGVTIIEMDDQMDHGPILAQTGVPISPWPDHYDTVEEKLGLVGGRILTELLPALVAGRLKAIPQDESQATYTKLVKKEDGLINMEDPAEKNLAKVLAYSTWPGAHMIYKNKHGKEIRAVVKDAEIVDGKFVPTRIIPAGKREMSWQEFLRGN
jgi:methionyl-tRNA formyltransferase